MDSADQNTPNLTSHTLLYLLQVSQRFDLEGVAVGGEPGTHGTRVQGHVGHLGVV